MSPTRRLNRSPLFPRALALTGALLGLIVVLSTHFPQLMAQSPEIWTIDCVDCPVSSLISDMGPNSLALEDTGAPVLAFGGDRLYLARWQGDEWTIETVDTGELSAGAYASLGLDAAGNAHITYQKNDFVTSTVSYAYLDGGTWRRETVAAVGLGGESALALDGSGTPHVLYIDGLNNALIYAIRTGVEQWQQETVESGGNYRALSLALDTAGNPHISYSSSYDPDERGLRYARKTATGWQLTRVDATEIVLESSLVLDSTGKPHIAYSTDYSADELRYARWSGSQWLTETVAVSGGRFPSLKLDVDNRPHISYRANNGNYDQRLLKYAWWDDDQWQTQTADERGAAGKYSSLALDDAGNPFISHFDDAAGELRVARNQDGNWSRTLVTGSYLPGKDTAIALDENDHAHIAYTEGRYENIKYAVWDGSHWQLETAIYDRGYGQFYGTALVLDTTNHARIAYRNNSNQLIVSAQSDTDWTTTTALDVNGRGRISHMTDSSGLSHLLFRQANHTLHYVWGEGANWQSEVAINAATSEPITGYGPSMALDSQGQPHIVFWDAEKGGLFFASRQNSGWVVEPVNADATTVYETSLKITADDIPHIAYQDWQNASTASLNYAIRNGGVWQWQVVDEDSYTGFYVSLALDATGHPHIGYRDDDHQSLRYAVWNGSSWETETVDEEGDVGEFLALAVDSQGKPHISYFDATQNRLKYAHLGAAPQPTATATNTLTPTVAPTVTPTVTPTATNTPKPNPTATPTATGTFVPTGTPGPTGSTDKTQIYLPSVRN